MTYYAIFDNQEGKLRMSLTDTSRQALERKVAVVLLALTDTPDHLMELILKREPADLSNFGTTAIIQQFEDQNAKRELKIDGQTIESISAFIEGKDFKNGINVVRPSAHLLKITCYGQSVAHEYEVIAV